MIRCKKHIALLIVSMIVLLGTALTTSAQWLKPLHQRDFNGKVIAYSSMQNNHQLVVVAEDKVLNTYLFNDFIPKAEWTLPISLNSETQIKNVSIAQVNQIWWLTLSVEEGEAQQTYLWYLDGADWISEPLPESYLEIHKLVNLKNTLTLVGEFNSEGDRYNIVQFVENEFLYKGTVVTRLQALDYIMDAHVNFGGELIVSGHFTSHVGVEALVAEWVNENWVYNFKPPFNYELQLFKPTENAWIAYGNDYNKSQTIRLGTGKDWNSIATPAQNVLEVYYDQGLLWMLTGEDLTNAELWVKHLDGNSGHKIEIDGQVVFWNQQNESAQIGIEKNGAIRLFELESYLSNLKGKVYHDLNKNCKFDEGDVPLKMQRIYVPELDLVLLTGSEGTYSVDVSAGNYNLSLQSLDIYTAQCKPTNRTIQLNEAQSETVDFPLQIVPGKLDVKTNVFSYDGWKSNGKNGVKLRICAKNTGSESIETGKLHFEIPSSFRQLEWAEPTPSMQNENTLSWDFEDLGIREEYCVEVVLKPGQHPPGGVEANFKANVDINGKPWNTGNGADTLPFTLTEGNDDPVNDKQVLQNERIDLQNSKFDYQLNFVNNIGFVAEKLVVVDTLDENIYLSIKGTEESWSHNGTLQEVQYTAVNENKVYIFTWVFDKINLPTYQTDPLGAKGFINLCVNYNPKITPQQVDLCNTAYFIFNNGEPIKSPTVCNKRLPDDSLNISVRPLGSLPEAQIYPNPAGDFVHIYQNDQSKTAYTIYTISGKEVMKGSVLPGKNTISLSTLPTGCYLVNIDGYQPVRLMVTH